MPVEELEELSKNKFDRWANLKKNKTSYPKYMTSRGFGVKTKKMTENMDDVLAQ